MDNEICYDIVDILNKYNIHFKDRMNTVTLKCPECSKYKLDINKKYGYYICYHCAIGKNIKGKDPTFILSKIINIPYFLLKNKLHASIDLNNFFKNKFEKEELASNPLIQKSDQNEINFPIFFYRINLNISIPGAEYLGKRGIPIEVAKKYGIRYNPLENQIVFPIYRNNKLFGYQTRTILKNFPKAFSKKTMLGFKKSFFFMFEDNITNDSIILAEGPISAMKFEKTGIPFVASMGKCISPAQMEILKNKNIKNIYLALDRDAYSETIVLIKNYKHIFNFFKIDIPEHRDDFGDCTFEECVKAYSSSYFVHENLLFPDF